MRIRIRPVLLLTVGVAFAGAACGSDEKCGSVCEEATTKARATLGRARSVLEGVVLALETTAGSVAIDLAYGCTSGSARLLGTIEVLDDGYGPGLTSGSLEVSYSACHYDFEVTTVDLQDGPIFLEVTSEYPDSSWEPWHFHVTATDDLQVDDRPCPVDLDFHWMATDGFWCGTPVYHRIPPDD